MIELLFLCCQSQPHIHTYLDGNLQTFFHVHGILLGDMGYSTFNRAKFKYVLCLVTEKQQSTNLHKDSLSLPAVLATCLLTVGRIEHLIGWDAGVCDSLLSSQHPDNHIRHAVLRLVDTNDLFIHIYYIYSYIYTHTHNLVCVLQLHYYTKDKHTSSASCLSLSSQPSMTLKQLLTSVASSNKLLAPSMMLCRALSRNFFI